MPVPPKAAERVGGVIGIHAAVAVNCNAAGQLRRKLLDVAEFRNEEIPFVVAVVVAVGERGHAPGDFSAAVRHEPGQAEIDAVTDKGCAGRVGRGSQAVLRQSDADTAHAC